MFIVTYFYNVLKIGPIIWDFLKNKVRQFLDIKRRAKKVYFRHGCMDYEIFRSDNDSAWRLIDSEAKNTMVKEHILEP